MLRTINEEYIIDVLKNHEFQLKKNQEEIKKILSGKDEAGLIRAAAINHSESFNSRTNELHDLDDVYRKYKKLTHDWELSVKEKIRALLEEQETINRILACYNSLSINERYVIEQLYIKNSYKEGIAKLMNENDKSRSTILRIRKNAVDNIREMYNSKFTNLEIYGIDKNKNQKYR